MLIKTIIQELNAIRILLSNQTLLQKKVLSFREASIYTGLSESALYKLTSQNKIAFSRPAGKKIYFEREKLDQFLLQNPIVTSNEIDSKASDYLIRNKRNN